MKAATPVGRAKPAVAPAVRMFISYSHLDEAHQKKLDVALTPLRHKGLETFFDGDILAGEKLDPKIARELRRADIFVALLSPDYMHSKYCWNIEYKRARGRQSRGTLRVVDVVVRDCDWKETKAALHKLLPKDGKAVSRWRSADTAWLDVIRGLKPVIAAVRADANRAKPTTSKRKPKPTTSTRKAPQPRARPASTKPRRRGKPKPK